MPRMSTVDAPVAWPAPMGRARIGGTLGGMISRNAPPPDSFTALREYRRRDSNLAILARPLTPANGER